MSIGTINLINNLILAPMAGITDLPFRVLCRQLGASVAVSEMTTSNPVLFRSRKTRQRLNLEGEPAPRVVQIAGADPLMMADAARNCVDQGAQIIDINMGCPAKKVCHVMAGSALLQDEKLVERILVAVVNAVAVPVTLKIRTGTEPSSRNAPVIARIAEQNGIQALTVHGRTRACRFSGMAEHDTVRKIKRTITIPVIANGDISTPEEAARVLNYTGADGIMIGRAARGNPWLFRETRHFLTTGEHLPAPAAAEKSAAIINHLQGIYELYGETQGVRIARKHIGWYFMLEPDSGPLLARVYETDRSEIQTALVRNYFNTTYAVSRAA
jgi:tRNA-dihydrouridine synthase B